MMMSKKDSKFAYYVHESQDGQPMTVEGTDATFSRVIEVTTTGWTPSTVDVWGVCTKCEQTVRVEFHSHSHKCELADVEGCSWVSPEDIEYPQMDGLIPPETIGDWDSSLYLVGPTGSNYGKRTRRVNGVVVESDEITHLPERAPRDLEELEAPFKCSYCKRTFHSATYYSLLHTCSGSAEARAMLKLLKAGFYDTDSERPQRTVVLREAASRDNWFDADRNKVPSELGKLDWMNPRQD